ncbi:MAG TPA: BolA family protein [Paracoccaceae bacterium]|nr:BolA family protein [Paracoccaceae bacterium]
MTPADPAEGPVARRMRIALEAAFEPRELEIRDDSERHRGHGGWREGGETHFHVRLVSPVFDGLSRVERQRRVHAALKAELEDRVHALSLSLSGTAAP